MERRYEMKILLGSSVKGINAEERTIDFLGSTEARDRMDEVILTSGWDLKNYKKNPVFMWAHDYGSPPIGKALNVRKTEEGLRFRVKFASQEAYPFADTIFRLYEGGYLNAVSVGFQPLAHEEGDGEKQPRRTYTKAELLELSAVPVPANQDALRLAVSKGIVTEEERVIYEMRALSEVSKPGFEETDEYIRYRVKNPDRFQEGSFRTITIKKDKPRVKAVIGRLKGETETTLQSLLFPKEDDWTIPKAREWVKAHPDVLKGIYICLMAEIHELNLKFYEFSKKSNPGGDSSQEPKGEQAKGAEQWVKGLLGDLREKRDTGLRDVIENAKGLGKKKENGES